MDTLQEKTKKNGRKFILPKFYLSVSRSYFMPLNSKCII